MAQAILHRIAAGDATAVQDCLNVYGGLVWALARRTLRNSDDTEDVVQEIFVDIWKYAERFDPSKASEATFVAMIARRRIIDRVRYVARRISPFSPEDMVAEPSSPGDQRMQTSVEAKQAGEALGELRPEQRTVLQLSIVHGIEALSKVHQTSPISEGNTGPIDSIFLLALVVASTLHLW